MTPRERYAMLLTVVLIEWLGRFSLPDAVTAALADLKTALSSWEAR